MEVHGIGPSRVVVHAHGRVGTADHVYAHDRIARLHEVVGARDMRCTVDLVDHGDAAGEERLARAALEIDGTTIRVSARDTTVRAAVDALEAELRRRLGHSEERSRVIVTGRRGRA